MRAKRADVKINGDTGFLILERSQLESSTPADPEILLNITVEVRGFAAQDQAWVLGPAWNSFISALGAGWSASVRAERSLKECHPTSFA
jgi:hypothetical protein